MDQEDPPGTVYATAADVRSAIEELSREEAARMHRAASYCMNGTRYGSATDLVNEALLRCLRAADGQKGRRWPTAVPFVAFMIQTIKGVANDSRESLEQRASVPLEDATLAAAAEVEAPGLRTYTTPDFVEQAIQLEEEQERIEKAAADAARIEAHFEGDAQMSWLIMGLKDDLSPSEIQAVSGMNQTQYNSARRKLRRHMEKLFPGRSKA